MSAAPVFTTGRRPNLWWMVNDDFMAPLEAMGLSQPETVSAWIRHGSEASRASSGRGRTQILSLPGRTEDLILRRTLHGGVLGPLWRGRLGSLKRIQRELEVTSSLQRAGAAVPCPALGIAVASGPLWLASIATVYIPDTVTSLDWLSLAHADTERTNRVAKSVGEALGYFHGCGGQHADLHAGNILVCEETERVRAWIIDLDKARFDEAKGGRRTAELKRLAHSLEKREWLQTIGQETRSCFTQAYEAGLEMGLHRARH
ncbi:MAG: lipopolysaccharide kinase InaA family protein [Myxococcota bacterium]|nr:lipopolysaccharide kinase InaA family protein [Myxococcota bacterium]